MKHIRIFIPLLVLCTILACCEEDDSNPTTCEQNCALAPEVGPCNAAIPIYYYDIIENKCKEFIWGGCAGVVPFETLEACESCNCQ